MKWVQAAEAYGVYLTAVQREQFQQYLALLVEWNGRFNLTAVRDPEQMERRHFLDSLTCNLATGSLNGRSLIDVGTGAGFPGLPLKILYPELRLTLVESVAKKARFLETAAAALHLSTVTVLNERAETIGRNPAHRERYDWAAARAVADLRVLAEYLLPLCAVGGKMLAQKGKTAVQEAENGVNALSILGGAPPVLRRLDDQMEPHYLIVSEKIAPTPEKYPRRVGMATKRPL